MFEYFDYMTIKDAVKFQEDNYYIINENNERVLNTSKIEEYRKELIDHISGGSKEQFDNYVTLDVVPVVKCQDGFIYTSHNGETITCIGCIADADNICDVETCYDLVCIADEIATDAFAITDTDKPITIFENLHLPYLKPKKLPSNSLRGQDCLESINSDNVTGEESINALDFVEIKDKELLTVKEAHELFNLSEKSLYDFANKNPHSHTLLKRGKKIFIKREKFKDFILSEAEWDYGNWHNDSKII